MLNSVVLAFVLFVSGGFSQSNDYILSLQTNKRHYQINGDTVKALSDGKALFTFKGSNVNDALLGKISYHFENNILTGPSGNSLVEVKDGRVIDLKSKAELITYNNMGIYDPKSGDKIMKLTSKVSPVVLALIAVGAL